MQYFKFFVVLFFVSFKLSAQPNYNWDYSGLNSHFIGCITEDNSGKLIAAEWQGYGDSIYYSEDNGLSWQSYGEINDSQYINIGSITLTANNNILAAAWGDNGGIYKSTDGSETWYPVNSGLRTNSISKIIRESDNLYAGAYDGVYLSVNEGETWQRLNSTPDSIINIQDIAKSEDGKLFVADFSNVLKSTDGGATWDTINNGISSGNFVRLIIVKEQYLFLGTRGYIYRSTDWGGSWEAIKSALVYDLVSNSSGYIIAGTENEGIILSSDFGESWQSINEGLPSPTYAHNVFFDNDNYAYSTIHNYGIYKTNSRIVSVKFEQLPEPASFRLLQNYPNPFNPTTTIKYTLAKDGFSKLEVFDILGARVAELVNQLQKAGTYEVLFDGSGLSSGTYFYNITSGEYSDARKMMLIK